jgi:hypothetical protein
MHSKTGDKTIDLLEYLKGMLNDASPENWWSINRAAQKGCPIFIGVISFPWFMQPQ